MSHSGFTASRRRALAPMFGAAQRGAMRDGGERRWVWGWEAGVVGPQTADPQGKPVGRVGPRWLVVGLRRAQGRQATLGRGVCSISPRLDAPNPRQRSPTPIASTTHHVGPTLPPASRWGFTVCGPAMRLFPPHCIATTPRFPPRRPHVHRQHVNPRLRYGTSPLPGQSGEVPDGTSPPRARNRQVPSGTSRLHDARGEVPDGTSGRWIKNAEVLSGTSASGDARGLVPVGTWRFGADQVSAMGCVIKSSGASGSSSMGLAALRRAE
jgi:hypothetical protein